MLDLGTLRIGIEADSDSAVTELDKVRKKTKDTEEQTEKTTKGMGSAWESFKGTLGALGVTSLFDSFVDSLSGIASEAIESEDALSKFESTMSFAGYDASTIEAAKSDMKDYADRTVYDLETVANTTAQLAANGVPNFEQLTEAAGNLNAVAGGSPETFQSLAMMLTQTAGAGKLTTENWNQLADAIPGASGVLQQALLDNGAYVGNFRDALEKGEITSDEFNQALMELGSQPVAVEAAQSVTTFEGAIGNLQATAVSAFQEIINTIGMENITGFINSLTSGVQAAIPFITSLVQGFMNFLPVLQQISPLIAAVAAGFVAFQVASTIVATVQGAVAAFNTFKGALQGTTIAQTALNAVMNANPFVLVATLVAALAAALVTLWTTNEGFRNAVISAWNMISSTASTVFNALANFFTVTVPNAIQTAISWFSQLPGSIAGFLSSVLSSVASWAGGVASSAAQAGSQFLSNVVNFISQVPGRVAGFLGSVISSVASWVGQMASNAANAASQFGSSLINGLASIPGRLVSVGKNIIQGLVNGITGSASSVINAIGGVVNNAIDWAKGLLGIHSPSKVFAEIGDFTMQGMEEGINSGLKGVLRTVKSASESVIGTFDVDLPDIEGNYRAYTSARVSGAATKATPTTTNRTTTVVVNNYSPKTLSEKESAREFKRSMRQLALA